jgi:DNA (cytosine-5)-methyltransferase 1
LNGSLPTTKRSRTFCKNANSMFVAAELFSGGGGLAQGLRDAGVQPVAAVELDEYAADVFAANHPGVELFRKDVRKVSGDELRATSSSGRVDILAACPPCQGFSTLTTKYRRPDPRNSLVAEVGRITRELQPAALMLENVPGLAGRGRPILDALIEDLEAAHYLVTWSVLQVADYGVPQMRRRLVLLAGRGFSIPMPDATHSQHGRGGLPRWRTLQDALTISAEPIRIDRARELGGFAKADWHVIRNLGPDNIARLQHAVPGKGRSSLPRHLRPPCHRTRDEGFTNTYGRMVWDQPSSTITAGCLSPSKGRFGHPDELRTISLREAALIQTFPSSYKFPGDKIDAACSVVGNALPCLFAEAIARRVVRSIVLSHPWLPDESQGERFSHK